MKHRAHNVTVSILLVCSGSTSQPCFVLLSFILILPQYFPRARTHCLYLVTQLFGYDLMALSLERCKYPEIVRENRKILKRRVKRSEIISSKIYQS